MRSRVYLLDTNALSEPLKPKPNAKFMRLLEAGDGAWAISAPTWHEALYGLHRLPVGQRRDEIASYLEMVAREVPVLGYDDRAASWHAVERARLSRAGRTPPFVDGQIAGIACVNDLTLVTANLADFAPFEGLRVEDWGLGRS